jgi:hypothetical protein
MDGKNLSLKEIALLAPKLKQCLFGSFSAP